MAIAQSDAWVRRGDAHTYEILGRVVSVLCDNGPLKECLNFRVWPLFHCGGYVLAWCGVTPTEDDVVEYLVEAAANDDWTRDLRAGDVLIGQWPPYTSIKVRGVMFQLRAEPMVQPETFAAMGEYWRTGELPHRPLSSSSC
ncbi:hypothetical protein [Nocardia salmonicida]|uniref:hypothetical protein n=1 Tax=Nocardia salmonicida TaxID=53431 RepID=UPI0037AB2E40